MSIESTRAEMPDGAYAFLGPLARPERGGTTQRVQDIIRDAIVKLQFAPGEFIDKIALCERLGVSRFPVSEALGRLADEGFVEVLAQRGTRISRISLADCRQAMFMRRALEGEAMTLIAPRVDDQLLARIAANMREQQIAVEQGDGVVFLQHDIAFHNILLGELGYERVKAAVDAGRASLDRARTYLLRTPRRQALAYEEHQAIVEALVARDGAEARRLMIHHLAMAIDEVEVAAAKNPDKFASDPKVS
jgi:GntR family transcriptional regulator, rspAB operon transcriptional repressor